MKYINLITGKVLEIDENASCKTCDGFDNGRCLNNKNIRYLVKENDLCFAYKQKILNEVPVERSEIEP